MSPAKKMAYYGIFASLAILMSYVERMVPVAVGVPGIKLGLANVVVLVILYFMGSKSAFIISLVRILIAGLLFSGFAGFLYSVSGALFSFLVMAVAKKTNMLSIVGVSVIGGIFHNIGQILTASLVVHTPKLMYYLPVLLVSGVVTGMITGIIGKYCIDYLKIHY